MRFLGPSSISSSLKAALDVIYYGLHIFIIVLVLAAACVLTVPNISRQVVQLMNITTEMRAGSQALMFAALAVELVGYLLIARWTRQVFRTLVEANVFHPDNISRLRWIGSGLAGVEVFGYVLRTAAESLMHIHFEIDGLRAATTWFAVLVVFVMAEVFKEGARLRHEADLTI